MIRAERLLSDSWDRALLLFPPGLRDVYFSRRYHELHVQNGDGEAVAVSAQEGDDLLFVSGLRQTVPGEPAWFDVQSCNGYSGPLAIGGASEPFVREAWASIQEALRDTGIVAVFLRLHPLLDNARWLPPEATVRSERRTACVSLGEGADAALARADPRHRNMVSKGRRTGTRVEWGAPGAWEAFEQLYGEAMVRLKAPPSLRFGRPYFDALRALPEAEIASVAENGKWVAAAVFLFGQRFAHYHLAARAGDCANHVTNCILHSAVERAAARGCEALHLGGGTTNAPDDPLLRFKASLGGPLLEHRVARVIVNAKGYEALVSAWTRRNGASPTWLLGYRQPPRENE